MRAKIQHLSNRIWLRIFVIVSWVIPDLILELLGLDYILWLEVVKLREEEHK